MKQGWEIKKLGDVCSIGDGNYSAKYPKASEFVDSGVPFLTATNLKSGTIVPEGIRYISKEQHSTLKKGHILKNDLVIVVRGSSTGNNSIVQEEYEGSNLNSQLVFLRIKNNELDSKYLFSVFNSPEVQRVVLDTITGSAQPQLPNNKLLDICIPIPPLSQQKRIVAILDEVFAAIAKAKTNTEQNLKNTKELFESYLQRVIENKGEDWEEKKLIEITHKIGSGATPRGGNESYKTEGISLVRSMNVHDFEFRAKNLAFIDDQQAKELNNVTLQESDVLLNITGASVARCCIIPKNYLPARVNQHVSIIRAKKEIIDPIFLNLLLTSKFYKDQLLFTGEQGATRQAITKAQLEVFKIAFPKSIAKQKSLLNKLEVISTKSKRLVGIYQKK
ncbi:MAG: restriction endonuclease subunit S [Saprospiraceae bacterium]|nr:restriction endonuclease subunit S [Candidatus Defluviibacterium haderslevense]